MTCEEKEKYFIEHLKSGRHFVIVIANRQDLCKNPTSELGGLIDLITTCIYLPSATRFKKRMRLQKDIWISWHIQ